MSELKQGSPSRLHGRFSITTALMLVIGLLTLVSVGTVLGIGIWLGQKNTFALLGENAQQAVQANVNSVRQYLSPVEKEARFLAERIASGELDPGNHREMELVFTGVLAAAEQIERLMFVDLELQAFVTRYRRRFDEVNSTIVDYAGDPIVVERMRELTPGANWGKPEWRESARKTYLDLAYPVYRDGEFAGAIMALLPLRHLSEFISSYRLGEAGNLFVLSGRDQVLGHSRMRRNRRHTDEGESPMPRLRKFDDPVLSSMMRWNDVHLVGTLFHELAHQKLYEKSDTEFNESFATSVEEFGVILWLQSKGDDAAVAAYKKDRELRQRLMSLVAEARSDLADYYAETLDDDEKRLLKEHRLDLLQEQVQATLKSEGREPDSWLAGNINNARLASISLYEGRVPEFRQTFADCDMDIECFYAKAEELAAR